jgi:hypothetical protein
MGEHGPSADRRPAAGSPAGSNYDDTSHQHHVLASTGAPPAHPERTAADNPPLPLLEPGFALSEQCCASLASRGFLPARNFLTPAGLDWCRGRADAMLAALQPGRPPAGIISPHLCNGGAWVWELITHPTVLTRAGPGGPADP